MATAGDDSSKKNVLTTNFDTYTLILQLGCILHTVPSWKRTYKLRVAVFVEYESDVEEERGRVATLLTARRVHLSIPLHTAYALWRAIHHSHLALDHPIALQRQAPHRADLFAPPFAFTPQATTWCRRLYRCLCALSIHSCKTSHLR